MSELCYCTNCIVHKKGLCRPCWGGGGVIPYMGHIGNCGLVGYGFSAVLVINRVSTQRILTILVISSVWFS